MPITIEQAKQLTYRDELHHDSIKNADGKTCARIRINGKVKLWKRNPNRIEIPYKHGLYDHGYLTENNINQFHLIDDCPQLHKMTCNDSNCTICNPPTFKPNSIL
jgi:hypothetical protein